MLRVMQVYQIISNFGVKIIYPRSSVDTCPTRKAGLPDLSRSRRGAEVFQGMKYFVYILRSLKYNKSYVGFTENPERRLKEHNSGKSKYTSKFIPWEIIHTEEFDDRSEARSKEKYYKTAAGRRRLKLLLNKD